MVDKRLVLEIVRSNRLDRDSPHGLQGSILRWTTAKPRLLLMVCIRSALASHTVGKGCSAGLNLDPALQRSAIQFAWRISVVRISVFDNAAAGCAAAHSFSCTLAARCFADPSCESAPHRKK